MLDNKDFKWTDGLVKEYIKNNFSCNPEHPFQIEQLERFKQSKENEFTVRAVKCYGGEVRNLYDGLYRLYCNGVGFDLDYLLKIPDTVILSVKRNKDMEAFSIGDLVTVGTIESFYIESGQMWVRHKSPVGTYNLSEIEKVKQRVPLFTTEDGVDIFEGDTRSLYLTDKDFTLWTNTAKNCVGDINTKYFFSSDKCKEYILMNKPSLSLNDLLSVWDKSCEVKYPANFYESAPLFKSFKELAKSKING